MQSGEPEVDDDLLDAILDGQPIDWKTVDGTTGMEPSLVRELKLLAVVADFHRAIPTTDDSDAEGDASLTGSGTKDSSLLWGHLRLVEKVGEGAFGRVYRAWDTRLDREVALKLIPVAAPAPEAESLTLIAEGRRLARVRHPNVVTIYGAERISDQIGLWMEFVHGQTLEQVLAIRRVISTTEVVTIGIELCRAVSAVHAVGLLHRDIKPQNVMRAEDGRILLMDFGTGRELDDGVSSDLTGTPLYLAPEVLRAQPASVRSDVYSLGVLLYHLLTGSYPVCGPTLRHIRQAHERGERTPAMTVGAIVPRRLARSIDRASDPDPERRYASVDELGATLAAIERRRRLRRPMSVVAATACVVAAVFIPSWLLTSRANRLDPARPTAGRSSVRIDADEMFRQGQALLDRRGLFNTEQAIDWFRKAIDVNPRFAAAHAGLANAYALRSFPYRGVDFDEAYPLMRESATKALALDQSAGEAHVAVGWVRAYEHRWAEAEQAFQRAIHLSPDLTQAYTSYSLSTLQPQKKYDEALRVLRIAAGKNPSSLDVQREIGEVQLYSGRYDDAVRTFQRVSAIEPEFPFIPTYLARALMLSGRVKESLPLLEPGAPWLAFAYIRSGRRAEAEQLAVEWERYPYRLAIIASALGDKERAFKALEEAADREPHRIGRLLSEPELTVLRDDRRFAAVQRRFGLQ